MQTPTWEPLIWKPGIFWAQLLVRDYCSRLLSDSCLLVWSPLHFNFPFPTSPEKTGSYCPISKFFCSTNWIFQLGILVYTFRKIMVGLSHLALPPLPFSLLNSLLIYFYLKSWHIELYYSFSSLLLSQVTRVSRLVNQHFSEFLNSNDFHFSSILGIDSHGHTRRNVNIRNTGKNISLVAIHCFLPHPLIYILLVQFYISFHSFFFFPLGIQGDLSWWFSAWRTPMETKYCCLLRTVIVLDYPVMVQSLSVTEYLWKIGKDLWCFLLDVIKRIGG